MKFPNRFWLFVSDRYAQRTGISDLLNTFPRLGGAKKAAYDAMEGEPVDEFFHHSTIHLVDTFTGESLTDIEVFAE